MTEVNPIVTLKAQAEELNFSKLRTAENNEKANSGTSMYLDFGRISFVINGEDIDQILIQALIKGAKQSELNAILQGYYQDVDISQDKKTDQYKEKIEEFYNLGKVYTNLFPKEEGGNYRPFAKEVFKEIFKYAGAEVPTDYILEELITNCNQVGYEKVYSPFQRELRDKHGLQMRVDDRKVCIECRDPNSVKVASKVPKAPVIIIGPPTEKICDTSFSLEFTLESEEGKDGVTYRDGNLSLDIPEELKNYQDGDKSLFDIIKGYFQKFCEMLGFTFEPKIEHNLGGPLKVNSHLKSVESPAHNNHGN